MEKQVLLNKLIERVNTMTDEQIAKVILDVWSNTDVASLLKQNEELKKQVEELREVIKQKWYTDIEFDGDKLVDSVKEAASKLKSLEEHNKQTFDAYALANNLNSGFACPKCGEELFYSNPNAALCTHPPQKSVCCNKCNYTGYVYC